MSPSPSLPDRLTTWWPRPELSRAAGLLALALFAVAGCKGEQASFARDGSAWVVGGGGTSAVAGAAGMGNGGKGGAAGMAGSAQTGGMGGAGNRAGGGGTASGGTGGPGGGGGGSAGAGGQAAGKFGDLCQTGADCQAGSCIHGLCCKTDCGTCQTCDSTGLACTNVMQQQDPRNDCAMTSKSLCGVSGMGCDGSGACLLWPALTVCSTATMCSGEGQAIQGSVCDGVGNCHTNAPQSCNGFLCQSNACLKSCTDGTSCVTGGFCGAGTCIGTTPNLAGNGDAEYGTTDGWSPIPNGTLSSTSTVANSGTYSIEDTGRAFNYQGVGYYLPTGLGQYNFSLWAMQNQYAAEQPDASSPQPPQGLVQLRIICANGGNGYYDGFVQQTMTQGQWVNFSGMIDTSDYVKWGNGGDCFPNGLNGGLNGMVRSAVLFLNEASGDSRFPNFYVDDLVVTVTDGHNLVGNPNFEAGIVDGWGTNAGFSGVLGSGSLNVSSTQANPPSKKSLWLSARTAWNAGIRYAMPTGAADYAVTLNVMHTGTSAHAIQLTAAYNCLGDPPSSIWTKTITSTSPLPGGQWAYLSLPTANGVAFPPSDARGGCKMTGAAFWITQADQGTSCGSGAGQVECPDLFVDDVNITLTTKPPID